MYINVYMSEKKERKKSMWKEGRKEGGVCRKKEKRKKRKKCI